MQLQEGMYLMGFRGEFDNMKKIIGFAKICASFFLLCSVLTFGFPIRSGHCEEPKANTALDERQKYFWKMSCDLRLYIRHMIPTFWLNFRFRL